ncbi:MAG TPA: hypothetical protein VGB74_01700 [Actinoplanes sp.]|jgi:hypothetical protein
MSNSAPQTRSGRSRNQVAILGGIVAGFIIVILLLLGFCSSSDGGETPAAPIVATTTVPPQTTEPTADPTDPTADPTDPTVEPTEPTRQPTATRTTRHTPLPNGGPDTGGGSTAPSGIIMFTVGLIILLAAVGATVQAFRPRRSRP